MSALVGLRLSAPDTLLDLLDHRRPGIHHIVELPLAFQSLSAVSVYLPLISQKYNVIVDPHDIRIDQRPEGCAELSGRKWRHLGCPQKGEHPLIGTTVMPRKPDCHGWVTALRSGEGLDASVRVRRIGAMAAAVDRAHAHALVDDLLGPSDQAADRAVAVLHAHAATLAWVRDTTSTYPAPASVAAQLDSAAERLRDGSDGRDPVAVLGQTAVDALAAYRSTAAA